MMDVSSAARDSARAATPHAKFERLAVIRVKAAVRAIRLLTRMGRSPVFEYSEADAAKIIRTLEAEIDALRHGLAEPGRQLDVEFDLS